MIEWLEKYLQRNTKALLLVTHDRYFLDRVCQTIVELDDRTAYTYRGNYAYYLEKRDERIAATNANIDRARNLYRKELDWMRRPAPSARSQKPFSQRSLLRIGATSPPPHGRARSATECQGRLHRF